MTDPTLPPGAGGDSALDAAHLDGFTLEELGEYLDSGRQPRDERIESSASAQHALAALSRLRAVAPKVMEAEAAAAPLRAPSWFKAILDQIGVQAHAGRDIPLAHDDARTRLAITEGAVRGLVRAAGDELDGILVEKSRLEGDVETPGSPVTVRVDVSLYTGADADNLLPALRRDIGRTLATHTELNVEEISIRVRDRDKDPEDDA
ncbi:MAG TPA: hypothetical protein VIL55_04690 [Naasia sp.]|jgi:uncharacterized alkaline shock family protein YloU